MHPEIIINLWQIIDDEGYIHLLKGRCYVHSGTEKEKYAFLAERALLDFHIAADFEVPDEFKSPSQDTNGEILLLAKYTDVESRGGDGVLFDQVFKQLEVSLSKFCPYTIKDDPLVLVTPIRFTDELKFEPFPDRFYKLND